MATYTVRLQFSHDLSFEKTKEELLAALDLIGVCLDEGDGDIWDGAVELMDERAWLLVSNLMKFPNRFMAYRSDITPTAYPVISLCQGGTRRWYGIAKSPEDWHQWKQHALCWWPLASPNHLEPSVSDEVELARVIGGPRLHSK